VFVTVFCWAYFCLIVCFCFSFQAWQSKYFVLRDIPPIFEYFKDEFSFHNARHTKEKNKISLDNLIHIGTTDASKTQRNAFMIVDAKKGAIYLAADSEEETKEWVDALNRVSGKSFSPCSTTGEFMYNESEQSSQPQSTTSSIGSPTLEDLGSPVSLPDSIQGNSLFDSSSSLRTVVPIPPSNPKSIIPV